MATSKSMNIDKTASLYNKVALWLLCALSLLGLVLMQLTGWSLMLEPICLSALFHIFCNVCYGQAWKAIARRSRETLTRFYLASSALRLMAAAMVLLVICVVRRGNVEAIKWFAVVFIVYYIVMLIFDALFFAKVSKNYNQ